MKDLLREWRDAREEIFSCGPYSGKTVTRPMWDRLSNAEHSLMEYARGLTSQPQYCNDCGQRD